jgi:hypothetical protein
MLQQPAPSILSRQLRASAAALRPQGKAGCPRPGHHQARRAGGQALLKRRIEDASRFVPLEQLCLSPQCGFSSTVEGNLLTYDEQVAKLRLIVETAKEVWG